MLEEREATRARVDHVIRSVVRPAVYPRTAPLSVSAHHVRGEPIPAAAALAAAYGPFAVGERWGPMWATTWFAMQGRVPAEWAGREVVALVDLGGQPGPGFTAEGLVWQDGAPIQGLHPRHREYVVARPARGGDPIAFHVEAAANPTPPFRLREWPLLLPDPDGPPLYVLTRAELAVADRAVEALWLDLRLAAQLVDAAAGPGPADALLSPLADACAAVDPDDVRGSVDEARARLGPVLRAPSRALHHVTAVGHAHIDSAWLWPVRETKRKCARTFANQLRLMEDYPEHRFACSQAQQYEWIRDGYPELWDGIRDAVARGQWEPVGGMWVEPDTNIPSGESLVRQVVLGKRFFLDELGVESSELWIPDVFGYSAALPQIARQAGITALITQKLSWNSVNVFPHTTFWWEGSDGSRLLTHFPPTNTYNGSFRAREIVAGDARLGARGSCERSLYPFGFGDGGGGPTREMLEDARRMRDVEGLPRIDVGSVRSFLDGLEAEAADGGGLGVWVGELYLEYHRGTYTTQAATKWANRRNEESLRAAEMFAVAAGRLEDYPAERLDQAWKLLLLNQFHDIIPGSSIHWVYDDAARDHATIAESTSTTIAAARAALVSGGGLTVFNAASSDRREVVERPDGTLVVAAVAMCGWAPLAGGVENEQALPPVTIGDHVMDNGRLRVTWDDDGLLASVYDLEHRREVLAEGQRGNVFHLHDDNPREYDAWDVDAEYLDTREELLEAASVEIVESDPLRAGVRVVRSFGSSTITQVMRLAAGSRRLEFRTEVDWQERHKFLKVAFPVAVRSSRATYEIQHGHIERPTVRNTSWDVARFEVCAQRWADLSETGYGVALLNDCKYGYDIHTNVMRLSLLRGPGWPDPEADRGRHRFSYALFPHAGSLQEAGVIEEAEAFNLPLEVVDGHGSGQIVRVEGRGVSVEAVKRADDGHGVVLRLCEVWGARRQVTVTVGVDAVNAARCDLLEREVESITLADGRLTLALQPFELVTLKYGLERA